MPTPALSTYWVRCATEEVGIRLRVTPADDIRSFRNRLYEARPEGPEYTQIQICLPGDAKDEIWMVKTPEERIDV